MAKPNRRRLSAIFFSDMKGFSRAMDEDENATLELLRDHNRILDEQVALHNGRVVKTVGDAYMVEFESSVDAVACALDCQRAIEGYNEDHACPIEIRIGVHSGDVVVEGDDVFGEAVNIAARLEPQAPVGGVCISAVVYSQVRKRVHATGVDMGEVALKNISEPMRLYVIVPGAEHLHVPGTPRTRVVSTQGSPGSSVRGAGLLVGIVAVCVCAGLLWLRSGTSPDPGEAPPQSANGDTTGSSERAASTPHRGGVLRLAGLYPFGGLWDLYPENYPLHQNLVDAVVDKFAYRGMGGGTVPGPVERWEVSADGLDVALVLREGVHFHDHPCLPDGEGRPATAADLAWSLEIARLYAEAAYQLDTEAPHGGLEVRDTRILRIALRSPWPYMERELLEIRLLPRELEGCEDPRGMKRLVGTGAFRLEQVTRNGGVILKRHPGYWGRNAQGLVLPYLDAVEWVPINDFNELIQEIHAGRLHLSYAPPEVLETFWDEPLSLHPSLKNAYEGLEVQVGYLPKYDREFELLTLELISREGGPLRSRDLRVALAHGLRRAHLPLQEAELVPYTRLLDKNSSGYDPLFSALGEDLELAKAEVRRVRASLEGTLPEIVLAASDELRPIAVQIALDASAVGLPIRVVSRGTPQKTHTRPPGGSIDAILTHQWIERTGTEICGLPRSVASERGNNGWEPGGMIDEFASAILISGEPEERATLYGKLERALIEDAYFIPLGTSGRQDVDYRLLYSPRLRGAFNQVTRMVIKYSSSHFDRWWIDPQPD